MKIKEITEYINNGVTVGEQTCDTYKIGNEENEVKKVAVTMFATVDNIRKMKEWGADFVIVHEPTFYDHFDTKFSEDVVAKEKYKLLEEAGITLYRWHDHPHSDKPDRIFEGEINYLGLKGESKPTNWGGSTVLTLDEPMTASEIVKIIEDKLNVRNLRVAGELNKKATKLACCFGTPGGVFDLLRDPEIEIVLTGETIEWMLCEYARDAAALGMNKSLIVMGHIGSERDGMRLLAEKLSKQFPSIETKYFECGEAYNYIR